MKRKLAIIALLNYFGCVNAETIIRINPTITMNSIKYEENINLETRYEEGNNIKISESDINYVPELFSKLEDFNQSYITREQYTKEIKKYVKNKVTGIEELVETKIVNYTIDVPKTRVVNVNLESTSNEINECTNWLPEENTITFGQEFNQERICTNSVNKIYNYFVEGTKINTQTIKEVINNQTENQTAVGTYLNLVQILSYTGSQATIKRTDGTSCSNTLTGETRRWYRASGDSCKGTLIDINTGLNISYNLDPNKITVIEIEGSANTSYYSYLTTSFFGGLFVTRDGSDFFGTACSNWWTTNCSLAANQPRISVSGFTTSKVYKYIYANGNLSYYIDGVLIKKIPFSTTGGVGGFAIGSNSGSTYFSRISVYENQ